MKCKICRIREGYEMLVVWEPVEFDDPGRISFGVDQVICNPSGNESVNPILPGVAYGWLLAPNCRKIPQIIDDIHPIPASTLSIGFSKYPEKDASMFEVSKVEELSAILAERYNGTINARLITDSSNANYIGIFYDRVASKLLAKRYSDTKNVKPYSALMLVGGDIRTGFTALKAAHSDLIDASSLPTFTDIILDKNKPSNIYVSKETISAVHHFVSTELDNFSNERKNLIFNAIKCFYPVPSEIKYSQEAGQDANGYY